MKLLLRILAELSTTKTTSAVGELQADNLCKIGIIQQINIKENKMIPSHMSQW